MQDRKVLGHIQELVDEEDKLYAQDHISDEDRARLAHLKVELDQCWDLLRQRRALREAGEDERGAHVRDERTVEGYLQ